MTKVELNDLPNVALYFLLAGVFFVIAIVILGSVQTTSVGVTTNTVDNESFTFPVLNGTITTSHTYLVAISAVYNSSNATFPAANYTISDATNGVIKFLDNTTVCKTGATCKVTYTYNTYNETEASVSLTNTINALAEIPNNWLLLIAVIVAAAIVIGIVISNLGGVRGGRV